jgi:hypothetical protein
MKYTVAFGTMSLLFAAGSLSYSGIWPLLLWSALSFGNVALAYAGIGPSVFGKRPDGTMPLPLKILNLPYLSFTSLVWHAARLYSRELPLHHISADLVIGRRLLPREAPEGFDHYVDLTAEFEEPASIRRRPGYRSLPILDASVPHPDDLWRLVEDTSSGKTFVHCAQGHGRTGLFALALMLRREEIHTVEDGLRLLRSFRPALRLNRAQLDFLKAYVKAQPPA